MEDRIDEQSKKVAWDPYGEVTKTEQLSDIQHINTSVEDLKDEQSKSSDVEVTKAEQLSGIQHINTSVEDLKDEQSKSSDVENTKAEQLSGIQHINTSVEDLKDEQSKSSDVENTKAEQLSGIQHINKSMEDLKDEQSKSSDVEITKAEQLSGIQHINKSLEDLKDEQSKSSDVEITKAEQLSGIQHINKSMEDLKDEQSKSSYVEITKAEQLNGIQHINKSVEDLKDEQSKNHDVEVTKAEQLKQERKEKVPFIYCRIVSKHPLKTFFLTLGGHLLLFVLSGILYLSGFELFPANFSTLPAELYDIPYRLRDFEWRHRDKYTNKVSRTINSATISYDRGYLDMLSSINIWYDTGDGNIFTKFNLKKIQQVENDLVSDSTYQKKFCMTENSTLTCKKPRSILRFFDGTYSSINAIFNDPSFSNISAVLYEAYTNAHTKLDFEYFLPKTFTITPTSTSASYTRSLLLIGCSLSGTSKCADEIDSQSETFLYSEMKPKLESWRSSASFDMYYYSYVLWKVDTAEQALKDMTLAIGSMLFIFCFILFHTRSAWISCWSVLSIFASFLGTNIIYRCIIGYKYFGFFHILSIFIILGIGADDLFVFYDTWRLSAFSSYLSLAHRLSDVYKKSALSMFITSLTTTIAFIASAISPLLATQSFGVFSGLLVAYNYISVIVFFPTVIITYHLKFEKWQWPCFRNCTCCHNKDDLVCPKSLTEMNNKALKANTEEKETNSKDNDIKIGNDRIKPNTSAMIYSKNTDKNYQSDNTRNSEELTKIRPTHQRHQKKMVIFFRDYYFKFITHKIIQWIVLSVFLGVVVYLAYQASRLEPENDTLKIYSDDHMYTKAYNKEQYGMLHSTSDNLVTIYIAFGLGLKDRSNCHFSSSNCHGTQVYDETFDPNPPANQFALKNLCDTLYNFTTQQLSDYKVKLDSTTGSPEIACFTRDLEAFLAAQNVGVLDLSLPWDHKKVVNFMTQLSPEYDVSKIDANFKNYLQIPIQYWLYNGNKLNYTEDFGTYNDMIGEETGSYSTSLLKDSNVTYGNNIKYIGIEINTTINRFVTGYSEGIPLVEKWEEFVSGEMAKMPSGLKNGYQLTRSIWHWLYVQETLKNNAIMGIAIGASLPFPILTLSTMNVMVGFLATFSICCTTICVIGVIPLAGYKLGFLVSLNMCLLVGLAVDYVVHLAEGYHLSLHTDRKNRTRDMLEEMGTSVFFGACTTLGASSFMFFSVIQFCTQFGIFLFCTVGFSLFFSLGLFTVLMGLIGPEGEFGSLMIPYRKLRKRFSKKKVHPSVKYSDACDMKRPDTATCVSTINV